MPNLTPEQIAKLEPDNPIFNVMGRLEKIQAGMIANDPELSTHLKSIWKEMSEFEELAHLLTPEEIGVLMKGLQKHTGIALVVEAAGKSSSKKGKVGLSDLI